jgi:branched-chain amino acid transport system ATP-binding protein
MSAPGPIMIEARALTAGYGELPAIRDVSLKVRQGEIVALFGPNGAGKTTCLAALAGDVSVMSGSVHLNGAPARGPLHKRVRRGLGYIPEQRAIVMGSTSRDNLLLGTGSLASGLSLFPELEPLLHRKAGLLSGGEQQMLILARALASRPRALLVDELSLGLAPKVVDRLLDALRAAATQDGVAILMVEQQARRAMRVADRWYLLRNGRISGENSDPKLLEEAYLAGRIPEQPTADSESSG